jgi:hypothetical protein
MTSRQSISDPAANAPDAARERGRTHEEAAADAALHVEQRVGA